MRRKTGVLVALLAGCFPVSGCGNKSTSGSGASDTDSRPSTGTIDSDSEPVICTDTVIVAESNLFENCPAEPLEGSCSDGWCRIEPGTFVLGSPETEPCRGKYSEKQVQVTLTRPFLMQQHEVTQAQWETMGFPNPSRNVHPNKPVTWINWFDAVAYCNALSESEGLEPCYDLSGCHGEVGSGCPNDGWYYDHGCVNVQGTDDLVPGLYHCFGNVHRYENWYECPGYRLPTMAEREYAARACTKTATYNGDVMTTSSGNCFVDEVLEPIAWYCGNSSELKEVGLKQPNPWNLYDMLGNVSEFIDLNETMKNLEYMEGKSGPLTDPVGDLTVYEDAIQNKGLQGGSYRMAACINRAAQRHVSLRAGRADVFGFRPVMTLVE